MHLCVLNRCLTQCHRYTYYNPLNYVPASLTWTSPEPRMTDGNDNDQHNAVGKLGPLQMWPTSGTYSSAGMRDWHSACSNMAPICEYPVKDLPFEFVHLPFYDPCVIVFAQLLADLFPARIAFW